MQLSSFIDAHLTWLIAGLIVFLGLILYGFRDLLRFSLGRAWAISKVAFSESIRRRVLWITPLAILAVIVVSQLQKPLDEQDAVRQTTKFCLFAAGFVVTVTAIILACTNLPKEIETRVIYTIVTKPTTRLEIVVGKVIGFAKVSLAILLIMGGFAYVYLHGRAWSLQRDISQRLESGAVDQSTRATYETWASEGLLSSRTFASAAEFQVLAHEPKPGETMRWLYGAGEGDAIVPFSLTEEQLTPAGLAPEDTLPGRLGLVVRLTIPFRKSLYGSAAPDRDPNSLPTGVAAPSSAPAPEKPGDAPARADVSISLLDPLYNIIVNPVKINGGRPVTLTDPSGRQPVLVEIDPSVAPDLAKPPYFFIAIAGASSGVEYGIDTKTDSDPLKDPVSLIVPGGTPQAAKIFGPITDSSSGRIASPRLRGRNGTSGQQLRGGKPDRSPVAVYKFRNVPPPAGLTAVPFEMRTAIERSDEGEGEADTTRLELVVINRGASTGADASSSARQASEPITVFPENNRTAYFSLPASAMAGGNFDIVIRNYSEGHFVGLGTNMLRMVAAESNFDLNLLKSVSILWMLSILVVIIAIFCSTFLSWPIGIVLTLVLLLGHWGVIQLGDSLAPGIGNTVATDLFGSNSNASQSRVVSASVEALAKILNRISVFLPDIGQFSAIDDIEEGITISAQRLIEPFKVLACFGLPMIVLSYVMLRNKEVAP